MSEIESVLLLLIQKIREYRMEGEVHNIIRVLRDRFDEGERFDEDKGKGKGKGKVRIGQITRTKDLISANDERRIYKGSFPQLIAVKQQPLEMERFKREKDIIKMLEEKDHYIRMLYSIEDGHNSYMAMEPSLCTLEDLMNFKLNREDRWNFRNLEDVLPPFDLYGHSKRTPPFDMDGHSIPRLQILKILRELIYEMTTRHSLGLGHSELNPQLVFLGMEAKPEGDGPDLAPLRVILYDYDKCKKDCKYVENASTAATKPHKPPGWIAHGWTDDYTDRWKSPEQLKGNEASLSSDMFVLGLISYYALHDGKHPFHGSEKICKKIVDCSADMSPFKYFPEAHHLIKNLLEKEPYKRGKVEQLRSHPIFWSHFKKMQFLLRVHEVVQVENNAKNNAKNNEVGDAAQSTQPENNAKNNEVGDAAQSTQSTQSTQPENNAKNNEVGDAAQSTQPESTLLTDLESTATKNQIFGINIQTWIPPFELRGSYGVHLVGELLRFVRNFSAHYLDGEDRPMILQGREADRPIFDEMYGIVIGHFPGLLLGVYDVIMKHRHTYGYLVE